MLQKRTVTRFEVEGRLPIVPTLQRGNAAPGAPAPILPAHPPPIPQESYTLERPPRRYNAERGNDQSKGIGSIGPSQLNRDPAHLKNFL